MADKCRRAADGTGKGQGSRQVPGLQRLGQDGRPGRRLGDDLPERARRRAASLGRGRCAGAIRSWGARPNSPPPQSSLQGTCQVAACGAVVSGVGNDSYAAASAIGVTSDSPLGGSCTQPAATRAQIDRVSSSTWANGWPRGLRKNPPARARPKRSNDCAAEASCRRRGRGDAF